MKRALWAATAFVVVATPLLVQGCSAQTTGQLVLVVQTDLSLPKDIDTIQIAVSVDGVPKFKNSYQKVGTPDGQIHLPGTIDLLAPDDPTQAVDIIVSAFSGGPFVPPRIVDEVVTTVPPDRAATLQVPLQFLCDGQATEVSGNPATTCPKGQTCNAGTCVTNKVDPTGLPTYSEEEVFGDGSCFDVARCFDDAAIADVDPKECTIDEGSHDVSIALETQGDGICGAIGCFVALDANDSSRLDDPQGRQDRAPARGLPQARERRHRPRRRGEGLGEVQAEGRQPADVRAVVEREEAAAAVHWARRARGRSSRPGVTRAQLRR